VAIGRRLVEEHLLDRNQFFAPVPPPSVSLAEPSFTLTDTGRLGQRIYWRGPTWVNAAWLVWLGLIRLGYREPAADLARRLADSVDRFGLREYYNPFTGAGMGAINFGWSTLVLEMLEPDPRAPSSYLPAEAPATG
jgi:glycogen debranching enzyme